MVKLKAYAKLTLVLEVIGRRQDGYHEIKGIFQSISLHDELTFESRESGLRLVVDTPALAKGNLVLSAARVLKEAIGDHRGAVITLAKGIPVGAGLGGGSTDAAAALRGLNSLWGLEMPLDELCRLGMAVGADVPFCVTGGTALVQGKGEKLSPLPTPDFFVVLVCPPFSLDEKTRRMYGALRPSHFTQGSKVDALAHALERGEGLHTGLLFNAFETVAWQLFPGLAEYRDYFLSAGASGVHLAGAGPVLFSVEHSVDRATEVSERLRREGMDVLVGRSVARLGPV